jgi:hypothetical protein
MATTKKAPAKKPAAKKTAAKPAAKKPAAKKTVAKKPAVKKPAAKKTAAKKPAGKTTAKKPVAGKSAVKKTVNDDTNVKFRNLFEAFAQNKLPFAQGYIVSSFFSESSAYSVFEIVSYAGVKEIYPTADGLTFVTGGKKLYVLVEPDTYHNKPLEPVSRSKTDGEYIPKRFNELETIIAKNQTRIMVAKEPNETFGSFTILEPKGINFSIVFYELPDVFDSLAAFFQATLNRQRKIPEGDAKKAAKLITDTITKTMSFVGEFQ